MARSDRRDLEWEFIKVVLPTKMRGKKRGDDRRVITGIFYVLRTGIPRADLPSEPDMRGHHALSFRCSNWHPSDYGSSFMSPLP